MAIGAKRSPLHDVAHVTNLASAIVARPGARARRADGLRGARSPASATRPPGKPLLRLALPVVQALSARELARRRAEIVDAVRSIAPLRFVNGGGTGSIERTAAEPAVTEVAAGCGPLRPDAVRHLPRLQAAARRAVRAAGGPQAVARSSRPRSAAATPPQAPRGATGCRARSCPRACGSTRARARARSRRRSRARPRPALRVGDRVWFRHAKAGELCERFDVVHLIRGGEIVDTVPTYRGEGKTFL